MRGSVAFHDICILRKDMALEKIRMETGVSRMLQGQQYHAHG